MIGLMTDKTYRQSVKTKYLDKEFNLIAIVTGIIITFIIWILVFIVTYSNIHPTNPSIFSLVLIETMELIGIAVIGGFIATYMAKEKRLLTGISVGLGIIIITIVMNVYEIIKGHLNPYIFSNPPFFLIANLGYVIVPTLGSYLAIILSKNQNKLQILTE